MTSHLVKNWFGDSFNTLAPALQTLHLQGGLLMGTVDVQFGSGLAGFVGKRLANKLGLPAAGKNNLCVTISHSEHHLHWDRKFNHSQEMQSTFQPIGNITEGYWLEKTGPLHVKLTVDVIDGGWYWRCLGFSFLGIPLPKWLMPDSKAYKTIEDNGYKFYVGFTAPILGLLLSYSGTLEKLMDTNQQK